MAIFSARRCDDAGTAASTPAGRDGMAGADRPDVPRRTRPAHPARRALALVCALAALAAQSACSGPPAPAPALPTVIAAPATAVVASDAVSYPGEVLARFESVLSFRVDGKIIERSAHLGERVHAQQVLARTDPGDSSAAAAAARAALQSAQQRLVLARQQRERNQAQSQDDLVSRAEIEQSDSAYAVAQAEVEQRRQDLALAERQSQYTVLRADHDGRITAESAEVGAVVKGGQPVYTLAWDGDIDVVIDVPETRIGQFAVGQSAQVHLRSDPQAAMTATVRDIAASADHQSRTFRVRLALARPGPVRLGTTAQVDVASGGTTGRLSIPASALFHDAAQPAVWVVRPDDGTLVLRRVEVAAYGADTVVLARGLAATDQVVLQGVHAVNAGEKVHAVPPREDATPAGTRP